jgi:Zn-finger protein
MAFSFLQEAVHGSPGILGYVVYADKQSDPQCPFYLVDEETQALWRSDLPGFVVRAHSYLFVIHPADDNQELAFNETMRNLNLADSNLDRRALFNNVVSWKIPYSDTEDVADHR